MCLEKGGEKTFPSLFREKGRLRKMIGRGFSHDLLIHFLESGYGDFAATFLTFHFPLVCHYQRKKENILTIFRHLSLLPLNRFLSLSLMAWLVWGTELEKVS